MKIPFRESIFPNFGCQAVKTLGSKLSYMELYLAIHDCEDLIEEQVMELQGLLAEKLKNRPEFHKPRSVAD